ncbi:MAG: helix-turn-helix transcriptional regulator [Oscillospiraceae bacterium]|nr:helix-turn-helix transcriptional regulator [Oscillospiraceae bacterium]
MSIYDRIQQKRFLIGERIKNERKKMGISQSKLSESIGVKDRGTLANWEDGMRLPELKNFCALCEVFECELGYLLCEHDCKTRVATDIHATTGLSEESINILRQLQKSDNLKARAIMEIINTLIESLKHNKEVWNLFQSIIAYAINKNLNLLWIEDQKIDLDDSLFPIEDVAHHDLTAYKVKGNFDKFLEYLLKLPKFKERAEEVFKSEKFDYFKYTEKQFELERKIPIDISDGSYQTAISQTLSLFFDDVHEEDSAPL